MNAIRDAWRAHKELEQQHSDLKRRHEERVTAYVDLSKRYDEQASRNFERSSKITELSTANKELQEKYDRLSKAYDRLKSAAFGQMYQAPYAVFADFGRSGDDKTVFTKAVFTTPRRTGKSILFTDKACSFNFEDVEARIQAWNAWGSACVRPTLMSDAAWKLRRDTLHLLPAMKRSPNEWERAAKNLAEGKPERHGFRWTRSEEEKLVTDYRARKSLDYLANMHKREWEAIVIRLGKLSGGWGMGDDVDKTVREMREFYFHNTDTLWGGGSCLLNPEHKPEYCS
jgi:hypothetical protein